MLSFGYIEDFHYGESVVLFCGLQADMVFLKEFFENVLKNDLNSAQLQNLDGFLAKGGVEINLKVNCSSRGLFQKTSLNHKQFNWNLSRDILKEFVLLTSEVACSKHPSHQYLETGTEGEIIVIVSTECSEEIFAVHSGGNR